MAEKINFELVSPAKLLVSQAVDMVVVPGTEGDFGALALHAPMIATVRPGVIDVHDNGKVASQIFIAGGFAEVNEERVTVLAEEAWALAEVTKDMADKRLKAAKQALADAQNDTDKAIAEKAMAVAVAMDAVAH